MRKGSGKIPALAVALIMALVGVAGIAGAATYLNQKAGTAATAASASPKLSFEYRSVSDSGDCGDYLWGSPCGN